MLETPDLKSIDPDAIVEEKIVPQLVTCAGDHFFLRQYGNEAKCAKCPLGYYLSVGMEVKNGHIYKDKELVI